MSRPLLVVVTEHSGRWRVSLMRVAVQRTGADGTTAIEACVRFQRRTLREAVEAYRAWRRTGVTASRRATCARCQRILAVTKAGLMRRHTRLGGRTCEGAGQPPAVNL